MNARRGPLESLRRPEYTGDDRCLPCTVVNLAIAVALAALVALVSPAAAFAVLGGSLAAIWLRGYLVPGTPELTKRYLPRRMLARFGKPPVERRPTPDFDPEAEFRGAGVVEDDPGADDVRLVPAFAAALGERTPPPGAADRRALTAALGAPGAAFEDYGEAVVASDGGTDAADAIAQWESPAAMAADLAAARVLPSWDASWARRPSAERALLCRSVRTLLDDCPDCGGPLVPSASTVESCCSRYEVLALTCEDCEARLFEARVD